MSIMNLLKKKQKNDEITKKMNSKRADNYVKIKITKKAKNLTLIEILRSKKKHRNFN